MRGLTSQPLQLFDDLGTGSEERRALDPPSGLTPAECAEAERFACAETWRPYPPKRPTSAHEPYSLAWFKEIEHRRYARHGRWLPKLFEFGRHRGEQVLALGGGLGTDWCRFAEGGAVVSYCSHAAEQLALVRRNFEQRGLRGQFLHAPAAALPVADGSVDVAVLSGLAGGSAATELVAEVFRVLKPGGKVLAALPAKYDARYWQDFWFPWARWLAPRPAAERHSARGLKHLFARFAEFRAVKRHLRRSDLPHVWRWMLLPVLERLMGRYLVVKAFKPLLAAPPATVAA
jgi:SAM-dependent methyltransferase